MENVMTSNSKLRIASPTRTLITGLLTGQIAGLIMAVVVMLVFAVFLGKSPLYPVQVIGSLLFGEAALQGFHLPALLAGLVLHQAGPALFWGAVYGVIAGMVPVKTTQRALLIGLGLGVVSMVDVYVLVPMAMNSLQGVDFWNREVPMFWDWAAHLVFGASFVLYPWVSRKLQRAE